MHAAIQQLEVIVFCVTFSLTLLWRSFASVVFTVVLLFIELCRHSFTHSSLMVTHRISVALRSESVRHLTLFSFLLGVVVLLHVHVFSRALAVGQRRGMHEQLCDCSGPMREKQAQITTLPPPWLTVGLRCLG